jgi:signal transduction histidine kinase
MQVNAGGLSMNTRACSPEIWAKTGLTADRRSGLRSPGEGVLHQAKRTAEAANQAKTEFLSTLCHEIRNPVSVMVGMMDLALQTNLTQEQREYLTLMKISSGAVLSVINHTLDIGKIEAGFIELESLAFSLRNSLGETVKMLTFEAQRKGLHLHFTVAADVPDGVRGDPMRLRQIVLNLISNAIKFTDHGEVVMRVTRQALADGQMTCCFAIADTGPGIALDKQAAIFTPFVQAWREWFGFGYRLAAGQVDEWQHLAGEPAGQRLYFLFHRLLWCAGRAVKSAADHAGLWYRLSIIR